jgi:hypothetical protein
MLSDRFPLNRPVPDSLILRQDRVSTLSSMGDPVFVRHLLGLVLAEQVRQRVNRQLS